MMNQPLKVSGMEARPPGDAALFPTDDRQLIDGIRNRQPWAASQLYRRLCPAVEHGLRRVLQTTDNEIDDLIQTTFERLIDTLLRGRFRGSCALNTWAVAIATNVALEVLRSRQREREILRRASTLHEVSTSENPILARVEVDEVHAVLARMKSKLVKTLILHDVLGYDLKEIAAMLDVSVAAAQSRLVRARKELLRRTNYRTASEAQPAGEQQQQQEECQ